MRAKNPVREDKRRGAHSRNANSFAAKVRDVAYLAIHRSLDTQTASVNSAGEFYIEALLDRFEKIHHEMVRDVEAAEGEHVFVIRPLAFHHFHIEPFLVEKAIFDGTKDGGFAGKTDVTDPDRSEEHTSELQSRFATSYA